MAEDGDSMFLQNTDICLQLHMALRMKKTDTDIFTTVGTSNLAHYF
jgi:hypothetical protein